MKFLCSIIGHLRIEDLHLELYQNDIVDVSLDEIKSSPRLREAIRQKELVPYDVGMHKNVRMIKRLNSSDKTNTINDIKPILEQISALSSKLEELMVDREDKSNAKLDKFLDKLDAVLSRPSSNNKSFPSYASNPSSTRINSEVLPIFVPKVNTDHIEKKVVTENTESSGTDDILEQLKKLKNKG